MIMQKTIEICVLSQFFIIFTIQDIKFQKISNSLIILGMCIKIAILFIFHDVIFTRNLFENAMISLFLIIIWIKRGMGGGDIKILLLYLFYIPSNSKFSLLLPVIFELNDRIEFFFFVFLLFLSSYVYDHFIVKKTLEEPRQQKILAPFFLVAFILSLIF